MIEITSPVGRLVGGHPMKQTPVTDKSGAPKLKADGVTPRMETYLAIAIAKGAETHWNQTAWGQLMVQEATAGWPNGEYNAPDYAWKVTDGDSMIPNKKGNKPCDKEGFPGHWVIHCKTELGTVKSYHVGKYAPEQQIQNANEIKPGDYCRVMMNVKANNPSESPGNYVNPELFELSRAGQEIQLGTAPSAADKFGASVPELPPGAMVDNNIPAPAPAANPAPAPAANPAPAHDFLDGPAAPAPEQFSYNGAIYTRQQLEASNWTPEQIAALPKA